MLKFRAFDGFVVDVLLVVVVDVPVVVGPFVPHAVKQYPAFVLQGLHPTLLTISIVVPEHPTLKDWVHVCLPFAHENLSLLDPDRTHPETLDVYVCRLEEQVESVPCARITKDMFAGTVDGVTTHDCFTLFVHAPRALGVQVEEIPLIVPNPPEQSLLT